MATVSREKNGTVRIWFADATGKRKGLRLGKVSDDYVNGFIARFNDLVSANIMNATPKPDLAQWVHGLSVTIQDRLARVGLIEIEQAEPEPNLVGKTLSEFVDEWMGSRHDVKQGTKNIYGRTRHFLVEYFGAECRLDAIKAGDADEWALHLRTKLNENTSRKHAANAKLIFKRAMRKGFIQSNPFADLPCNVTHDETRDFTVTREIFDKVVAFAPDAEWRLIMALARFGGLRVPSEIYALTWGAVDLRMGRFTIRSPKTERYKGKGSRVCPIFPELRPYFEEALLAASDGSGRVAGDRHVVEQHRLNSGNLSTQFRRFIRRAGLEPWEQLWHNCRATRQTELENEFPTHVVCSWLGNSPAVAQRHYLRVTESHFEQAIGAGAESGANTGEMVQDKGGQLVTKRVTGSAVSTRKRSVFSASPTKNAIARVYRMDGVQCSDKDSNLGPTD